VRGVSIPVTTLSASWGFGSESPPKVVSGSSPSHPKGEKRKEEKRREKKKREKKRREKKRREKKRREKKRREEGM
jgi:hypothetical protein